ncbi:MAG: hypothetical protein V7752_22295 [Halopseudomonas sp.]
MLALAANFYAWGVGMYYWCKIVVRYTATWMLLMVINPSWGQEPASRVLNIGYFDNPPHIFISIGGKPSGAAFRYFEEVLRPRVEGVDWAWEYQPLARLLRSLENGSLDGAVFLIGSKSRARYLDYSSVPFFVDRPSIFFLKSRFPAREPTTDKLLAMEIDVTNAGYLPEMLTGKRVKLSVLAGEAVEERALKRLIMGRSGAFYSPTTEDILYWLSAYRMAEQVGHVYIDSKPLELFFVFSKSVPEQFRVRLDKEMTNTLKVAPYSRFLEHYRLGVESFPPLQKGP